MNKKKKIGLILALVLIGTVTLGIVVRLANHGERHLFIPTRNVVSDHRGTTLNLYLRDEDSFPAFFGFLKRLHIWPIGYSGTFTPKASWTVLNMDATRFEDAIHRYNLKRVEIEVLNDDCCLVIDSKIPASRFRTSPRKLDEGMPDFDVQQKYPQYFAPAQ